MKDEIRNAMARAFFASAWAEQMEENDESDSFSQLDIMDVMPQEIDPAAYHAADTLIMDMERANGKTIEELFPEDEIEVGDFGHYAAMGAMSSGVGLSDFDCCDGIHVPSALFGDYSLEKDYPAFRREVSQ